MYATVWGIPLPWMLLALAFVVLVAQPIAVARAVSALVRWMAWIVRWPAWVLNRIEVGAYSVMVKSASWKQAQDAEESREHWAGLVVIARLMYFSLSMSILLGAMTLDISSSCVMLNSCDVPTASPVPVSPSLANGMLMFSLASFWGIILLDGLDSVPPPLRIFGGLPPFARKLFLRVALVGEIVLTLVMGGLFFIRTLATFGYSFPLGVVIIATIQGMLLNVAAIVAFVAAILGLMALVTVVCLVIWLVATGLRLVFHGLEQLGTAAADHVIPHLIYAVSGTLRGIWNALISIPPMRWLNLPQLVSINTLIGQAQLAGEPVPPPMVLHDPYAAPTPTAAFAGNAPGGLSRSPVVSVSESSFAPSALPSPQSEHPTELPAETTQLQEEPSSVSPSTLPPSSVVQRSLPQPLEGDALTDSLMAPTEALVSNDPTTSTKTTLIWLDEEGHRFIDKLLQRSRRINGSAAFRAVGGCNFTNLSDAPLAPDTVAGDILDISITAAQIQEALRKGGSPREERSLLARQLFDHVVKANKGIYEAHPQLVIACNLRTLTPEIGREIAHTHKRLPNSSTILVTNLPTSDQYDRDLEVRATTLSTLRQEKAVLASIPMDPNSPLSGVVGIGQQEVYAASALASVLVAHAHRRENATFLNVFSRLSRRSTFVVLSIASANVVAGKLVRGAGVLNRLLGGTIQGGIGDLNDIRARAQEVTERVVTDATARVIDVAPSLERGLAFLVYTLPLHLEDPRFTTLVDGLSRWLRQTYPGAGIVPLFVQGNGVADENLGGVSPYYVQASLFFGLKSLIFEGIEDLDEEEGTGQTDSSGSSERESPQTRRHHRKRLQPLDTLGDFDLPRPQSPDADPDGQDDPHDPSAA